MTSLPGVTSHPKPREPQTLNPLLLNRLLTYTTLAGAGAACLSSYAKAEVVYTPVHASLNHSYPLDLNHDGIVDYTLVSSKVGASNSYILRVEGFQEGNRIVGEFKGCFSVYVNAAALAPGVMVGPGIDRQYTLPVTCMGFGFGHISTGPWAGAQERYLGFGFHVDGTIHYGWARLSVNDVPCDGCLAQIEGYAYETIPGKAITTGEEGPDSSARAKKVTLGGLALGMK